MIPAPRACQRSYLVTVSFTATVLVVLSGCGVPDRTLNANTDTGSSGGGGGQPANATPYTACLDFSDAFAQTFERCGLGTYNDGLTAIMTSAANGDCHTIIQIRDQSSFYGQCIPWMHNVACSAVTSPDFAIDASCKGQLIHP